MQLGKNFPTKILMFVKSAITIQSIYLVSKITSKRAAAATTAALNKDFKISVRKDLLYKFVLALIPMHSVV